MTDSPVPDVPLPRRQSAGKSVAVNAASLFAGRFISAMSIFFALIVLTKLSDARTVGIYALAQALCIPIAEIAKMSLREVRSSDVRNDYSTADYFRLRLIMTGLAALVMAATGAIQSDGALILTVILLYGLTRCLEMLQDVVYAHFQLLERMDYIGRSLCIVGPLSLLALSVGFYLTESLIVAVSGQVIAFLAVLVFHDLPISRRLSRDTGVTPPPPNWNLPKLMTLARIVLPMAFATSLVMIAIYVPRVWVGEELGVAALGFFGPIVALVMAPDRLIGSLCHALSVRLARHHAEGRTGTMLLRLAQMVGGLLVLGLPGILICHLYGDTLLRIVFSEEFSDQVPLLVLLSIASLLRILANVMGFGFIASRNFWWITFQSAVIAMVALLSCYFLIGRFGLIGAGWTMILIFGTQFCLALTGLALLRAGKIPGGHVA